MAQAGKATILTLPLVGHVKEGRIFHDRAAERTAKLVIVKRILRHRAAVEKISGVQRVVAKIFERAAVDLVCAGLGDDVDDGARITAKLRVSA